MNEYPRAAEWLYATLHGDSALMAAVSGIYEHPAPQGSTYPVVTFQQQAEVDVEVIDANRVWAEFTILVRVIGQTASTASLKAAADRLDALLHRVSGVTADSQVISCVRTEVFHLAEEVNGVSYRHLGGLYSLLVQPLNP